MIPEEISLLVLIFVLGTIAGSFINCLAWRIKQEETILGSSYCPKCRHKLGFFDLFPIWSFFFLRGRCRYCKEKISFQYPLVEILTGLAFVFVYHYTGFDLLTFNFQNIQFYELIFRWLLSVFLLAAFIYDLKYFVIPDRITFSAIILTFLWIIAGFFLKHYTEMQVLNFLFSGLVSSFFFFCLWFFSQGRAMGFGDVKLAFLLGLFLGYPVIIPALFVSFFLGALIGIILVFLKKKKMKSEVPFGPFLVMGSFIGLAWGKDILLWYLSFLK
ncbi:MAG: prepilin peptidase [Candidatus Pacebacteria bacterium]|jgi:prepilin signal peptidase PulO-like enzyme (type II secretory pathway)|nr:prepilin peptidase [Candidatus Paceibacterota bacterium]